MSASSRGATAGGTIVAILVTLVVYTIVSVVVAMIFGLFYALLTVLRPGIIQFFGSIISGVAGIYAARASCDAILRHYSSKVVFVAVALLCLVGVGFELSLPMTAERVAPIAQVIAVIATAWALFWRYDQI